LRAVLVLAISDICADVGEAFLGTTSKRKFVWRQMRRFLSSENTAGLYAFDARSEPNFLSCSAVRPVAACFGWTMKASLGAVIVHSQAVKPLHRIAVHGRAFA
jgi:hypothetical protein